MQDLARRRGDLLRIGITQHRERDLWLRALEEIYINCRPRRSLCSVLMHVANHANDRQQAEVSIHATKFDSSADGVLPGPARARDGCADKGGVRRVRAIAIIEHSPAEQRDPEGVEVSLSGYAKIRFPEPLFLAEESVQIVNHLL